MVLEKSRTGKRKSVLTRRTLKGRRDFEKFDDDSQSPALVSKAVISVVRERVVVVGKNGVSNEASGSVGVLSKSRRRRSEVSSFELRDLEKGGRTRPIMKKNAR